MDRLRKRSYFLIVGAVALAASLFVFSFGAPVQGFRLLQWGVSGVVGVVFVIYGLFRPRGRN
jgi:hypothetical protein